MELSEWLSGVILKRLFLDRVEISVEEVRWDPEEAGGSLASIWNLLIWITDYIVGIWDRPEVAQSLVSDKSQAFSVIGLSGLGLHCVQ